jgi:hypothetical protein
LKIFASLLLVFLTFLPLEAPASDGRAGDAGSSGCVFRRAAAPAAWDRDRTPAELWPSVVIVLGILAGFGAFGGMLSAWGEVPIADVLKKGLAGTYTNWARIRGISFLGMMWGAGGSLSFGVILALDEKFRDLDRFDGERFIFLACSAVAAGFSGIRLLHLVSGKLEDQVNKAKKEAMEAKEEVAKVRAQAEAARGEIEKIVVKSQQLAGAFSFTSQILSALDAGSPPLKPDDSSVTRAIELMEEARIGNPDLRLVGVYLGRLQKARGKFREAINALTLVYEARGEPRNKDDAALLFNRACYRNLLRLGETDPEVQRKLLIEAQKDLDDACKLDADNIAEAKTDQELRGLTGGPAA